MNEILDKPLNQFVSEDLQVIRQLADTMFNRLVQPFKQNRVVFEFDHKASIRQAMRTGVLSPAYVRHEKTHPKSQVVIAMSLSGIDRCFAVGLIPLLSQLRKYLNFRLFVYTDDLVEAEFGDDGFIHNDCDIAWNNVLAPVVFSRLADMTFDAQETKLLLVDSLGGKDSTWYTSVYEETLKEVAEAQRQFVGWNNPWTSVRNKLKGRYEKFDDLPKYMLPQDWAARLERNCETRWVETPAMKDYLIRHIFNPRYGEKIHGGFKLDSYVLKIDKVLGLVKEKFKSVHLLTPFVEDEYNFDTLKSMRFVDFRHKGNTLEGFAQTLINIVYGRETDRLTTPIIKFVKYFENKEDNEEERGHSELIRTSRSCFKSCLNVADPLPEQKTHQFPRRKRGTSYIQMVDVPYSKLEILSFFRNDSLGRIFGDWRIDPMWTEYGKKRKAESIFNLVKEFRISLDYSNSFCIVPREVESWEKLKGEVAYEPHRTRVVRPIVEEFFNLFPSTYKKWFEKLPLKNVVWCTSGKFVPTCMAISVSPADDNTEKRATIYHEAAHWVEHVCPPVGVFTNNMVEYMTGGFAENKVVTVGQGEVAMPVRNGLTPWIVPYAGKWYKRYAPELPNPTEIFSVHMEYFSSLEKLAKLLEHDVTMAQAVAFIIMGGPLSLIERATAKKKDEVLQDIEQRRTKAEEYEERKMRGRGGRTKTPSPHHEPTIRHNDFEEKSFSI